jgi:hypothetical protein
MNVEILMKISINMLKSSDQVLFRIDTMKSSMVRIINSGFISKTALEGTGC